MGQTNIILLHVLRGRMLFLLSLLPICQYYVDKTIVLCSNTNKCKRVYYNGLEWTYDTTKFKQLGAAWDRFYGGSRTYVLYINITV